MRRPGHRSRPGLLGLLALVVVAAAASPLVFVVLQAIHAGWSTAHRLLLRPLAATLLWNTLTLTATVTVTTAVLGFAAAYLVERTDLPARGVFSVLLAMPLAIPEFVQSYSWVSLTPGVHGLGGAWLVMSLALYPLVFLPVAASLRRSDHAAEEVSRSLGRGRWATLWRVTLPMSRPALAGGALLVCLYLLGEYGAFAVLRFTTFATAIFAEYQLGFDAASASVLTLVLCTLAVLIVATETLTGGRRRVASTAAQGRSGGRLRLGRGRPVAVAGLITLLLLALGVPLWALAYWLVQGNSSTLPSASILSAAGTTLSYTLVSALVATVAAVPVALYSWRRGGRLAVTAERAAYLTRALPGIAVGLSLVYFAVRYARPLYEKPPLLVAAYAVLFFPLALTGVRAALAQVPRDIEDVARSLGVRPRAVLGRVTLPLILPGLGVAAALVALSASTELTATLLLRPTGTETLATRFWQYTTGLSYGAAAPYAALMIGLSVVPVLLLARRGTRSGVAASA